VTILVVSIGNPLRRDDGAAHAAVAGLARDGLRVASVHQLAPELAEDVAAAAGVVLVDARAGGAPGDVAVEEVRSGPGGSLGHALSPGELLALAAALAGAERPARLVTVAAGDLGFGGGLSPEVARAIPSLRAAIEAAAAALTSHGP
jgi:hydrogenase maturation protease